MDEFWIPLLKFTAFQLNWLSCCALYGDAKRLPVLRWQFSSPVNKALFVICFLVAVQLLSLLYHTATAVVFVLCLTMLHLGLLTIAAPVLERKRYLVLGMTLVLAMMAWLGEN